MLYQHIRDGSSGPYQIYVRDERNKWIEWAVAETA